MKRLDFVGHTEKTTSIYPVYFKEFRYALNGQRRLFETLTFQAISSNSHTLFFDFSVTLCDLLPVHRRSH